MAGNPEPIKHTLCPPKDVVTAARATMGGIDLNPWATAETNRLVEAARYYNETELSLADVLSRPWEAAGRKRALVSPPRGSQPARRMINKTLKEYRMGRISQAVIWVNQNECATKIPWIWDFPVCIPFKRLRPCYWDDEVGRFINVSPATWTLVFYLPPCSDSRVYLSAAARFHHAFGALGRIIVNDCAGETDWMDAYAQNTGKKYSYYT